MSDFKTPVKSSRKLTASETPIVIPPSPFLKQLGYGTGVSVYQMVRSPRVGKVFSPWAVKRISQRTGKNTVFGKRLLDEAKILKQISHPNVVGFRAFTKMGDGRQCLAMEACESSLGDKIESRVEINQGPFPPVKILKVALDISKALDFIHTQVKLLHGDIKSFNILVNGDFEICKLCDFGVSLPLDDNGNLDYTKTSESYIGTECWSAPEVLNENIVCTKADIFSFGLTLWEMLSLEPPHVSDIQDDPTLDESVILIEDSIVSNDPSALYGTRPDVPDLDQEEYKDVLALFYCMTEELPQSRPSAHHLVLCAEDMLTRYVGK